jgi:cell division protein FtsB
LALLFAGLMLYFLFSPNDFFRLWRLESKRQALERDIDTLGKKLEAARQDIEKIKQDKDYLEKVAREKLGMAKPGEKVYKFIEEKQK